jgi:membrane-bound lytic murein transglycosylase B
MRPSAALVAVCLGLAGCSGEERPEAAVERSGGGVAAGAATTAPGGSSPPAAAAPPGDDGAGTPPSDAPEAPATPAALAEQLTAAETAIRDPATPAGQLPRLGWTQQVAYRVLVRNPAWREEVYSLLPPALRPSAQANVAAGEDLMRLAGPPRPELPKWRIVTPAPAAELLGYYREAQDAVGVPWRYLAAIHLVETRMGRIRGTSVAGAQGPMQFIPSSWDLYGAGGDINDNHDSILAAARHLVAGGAPADMAAALYAYNPSQRYVRAVTAYAEQMGANERAYLGYYYWQVYYGDHLLPEGYAG